MTQQNPDHARLFQSIGAAQPENNFGQYLRSGRHVLTVLKYEIKPVEGQTIIAAEFVVNESQGANGHASHSPGEKVSTMWRMTGLTKDWQIKKENSKAQAFIICLLEAANEVAARKAQDPRQAEAWLQEQGLSLVTPAQIGRGRMIVAHGDAPAYAKDAAKAAEQKANNGGFVEVSWSPAPTGANQPEAIAGRRAQLDQQYGPPVLYGMLQGQSAPSYGHAMQQAPMPAQQYQQPPGYAPAQQYQQPPGYAPAPAPMQAPPANPYAQPPHGQPYGYPPAQPAPPAQQYQQPPPGYAPAPIQPAPAPAGYPPGTLPPGLS